MVIARLVVAARFVHPHAKPSLLTGLRIRVRQATSIQSRD